MKGWSFALSAGLTLATHDASAQRSDPAVDSAAVARRAFRAASQATSPREALLLLQRGARAWPVQPAYWMSVVRVGARVGDSSAVREALDALSTLGAGAPVLADSATVRLTAVPALSESVSRLQRATADLNAGRVIATLPDTTVFAEGLDADPRTDNLYVGSVRHRTILEVTPDGRVRDLQVARHSQIGAITGVRVAADGRTLYATTAGLPQMRDYRERDSSIAAVVRIAIVDGALIDRWDVPADGRSHLLGDLAIAGDGSVYATDSKAPLFFRLRPRARALESITHPLFRSLQGIAPIPGTRDVIVADYSHGLLRVDFSRRRVRRLVNAGGSTSLGVDGILWVDHSVIGVQNGVEPARIVRFTIDATYSRISRVDVLDRQATVATEPTIGTLWRGGFAYVANSQWDEYDDAGVRRAGTMLRPTVLICVPLRAPSSCTDASRKP